MNFYPLKGLVLILFFTACTAERKFNIDSEEILEASITELQELMDSNELSARQLTEIYLERIYTFDRNGPRINSILEVNPDAIRIAEELDLERKKNGPRSLLHGIPVILKDAIGTADKMRTSNGSYLFIDAKPKEDATIVKKLREAGALIIAKGNMDEMACCNGIASGRGGAVRNPYALDRFANGSSSGPAAGVASNLAVFSIGGDSQSSIRFPASSTSLVGLKPTMGLISRAGVIPGDVHIDVVGPMTRTVEDAAIVTSVLAFKDEKDSYTLLQNRPENVDYLKSITTKPLHKTRLGIARNGFFGYNSEIDSVIQKSIDILKMNDAELIDSIAINSVPYAGGRRQDNKLLSASRNWAMDNYLKGLTDDSPIRSIEQLANAAWFNKVPTILPNHKKYLTWNIEGRTTTDFPVDSPKIKAAYKRFISDQRLQILPLMDSLKIDFIIFPTTSTITDKLIKDLNKEEPLSEGRGKPQIASYGGLPEITVPAGYTREGFPIGLSILGRPFSEDKLLAFAYAFEQKTNFRKAPDLTKKPPPVKNECPKVSKNDLFENKMILKNLEGNIIGNIIRAGIQANEPRFSSENIDRSVWFSYVAPRTGTFTIQTHRSFQNTYDLAIYQGRKITDLELLSYQHWNYNTKNTQLVTKVQKGKIYQIILGTNENKVASGYYELNWNLE